MRTSHAYAALATLALIIIVLFPSCAECGERKPEEVAHATLTQQQELWSLIRACSDYAIHHGVPPSDPAFSAVVKNCLRGPSNPELYPAR